MDGVRSVERGVEHGVTRWDQQDPPPQPLTQASARAGRTPQTMPFGGAFNDLDLILMDALDPGSAYSAQGGEIRWMEGALASGLGYHGGLTVALSRYDHVSFGFFGDPRKLAVRRTDGTVLPVADLGDGHDFRRPVALRVVARGGELRFQAAWSPIDLVDASGDDSPVAGGPVTLMSDRFTTVGVLPVAQRPSRRWRPADDLGARGVP